MVKYKTIVRGIGSEAKLFKEENMLILFGIDAPDSLKDYCYTIEVNPIVEEIRAGMKLRIDENYFTITAIGNVVNKNLSELGHVTIKFDGDTLSELPGTMHVSQSDYPEINIGSILEIH
ncbi:PTS glucitol/sorbitol transporter subunit IIA [Carnobacterium maltaromaticum]|uniref:PTS glucitol/sorbitol transporter subunit IIA n=1 Tax=Carnobacterium maltaromaticum TaxID=2751 RepID=UPI0039BDC40E